MWGPCAPGLGIRAAASRPGGPASPGPSGAGLSSAAGAPPATAYPSPPAFGGLPAPSSGRQPALLPATTREQAAARAHASQVSDRNPCAHRVPGPGDKGPVAKWHQARSSVTPPQEGPGARRAGRAATTSRRVIPDFHSLRPPPLSRLQSGSQRPTAPPSAAPIEQPVRVGGFQPLP